MRSNRGRGDLPAHDAELVTQHEDLDVLRTVGAAAEDEEIDDQSDETVEARHPSSLPLAPVTRTRNSRSPHRRGFRQAQVAVFYTKVRGRTLGLLLVAAH